ncbi:MAG TPA: hypothetical protein VFY39_03260 [Gammaproteobacteria bacterium]|nr:hypothetical protein [Gammaproteobacteria bacterium]
MKIAFSGLLAAGVFVLLGGYESLGTAQAQDRGGDGQVFGPQNGVVFGQQRGGISGRDGGVFSQNPPGVPFGVKLLRSDTTSCQGVLLASDIGNAANGVQGVRPGEQRVFEVVRKDVPWACLSQDSASSGKMICPQGTNQVRLTLDRDVAKFECFGRAR